MFTSYRRHEALTQDATDATSATLKPHTPSQNTPALTATYKTNIASINTAVTGATNNVKKTLASPPPAKRDLALASRQAAVSLPGELALILEEIGGALNEIIATLGLSEYPRCFRYIHTYLIVINSYDTFLPRAAGRILGGIDCIAYPCCEQSIDSC